MKLRFIPLAMLLSAGCVASQVVAGEVSTKVAPTASVTTTSPVAKDGAKAPKPKLIDINSASSVELQKLPGISAADATKIIAGRPYGSKTWLVSHKILAEEKYPAIQGLIIAKQPNKDAGKNAELYKKK